MQSDVNPSNLNKNLKPSEKTQENYYEGPFDLFTNSYDHLYGYLYEEFDMSTNIFFFEKCKFLIFVKNWLIEHIGFFFTKR